MVSVKRLFFVVVSIAVLYGCGGTTPVPDTVVAVADSPKTQSLMDTLAFIPQQKLDSKNNPLPYKPQKNPYVQGFGEPSQAMKAQFAAANAALEAGDLASAEQQALALQLKNPKLSGPEVLLGDIAAARGQLAQAESHYINALEVNGNNVNAYLRLAKVQRMQGGFAQAQNTYAAVLALWPDFPEAHLNLGVLYDIYLNDDVKAQRHIEAYQFLTGSQNQRVANWLQEIQQRTGLSANFKIQVATPAVKPVG